MHLSARPDSCVSRFTLDDITLKKSIPYVRELTNSSFSLAQPIDGIQRLMLTFRSFTRRFD